ncbi:hypothetical protein TNCV_1783891 [Trichonephila clavipes]|nr:hypothetical protein TNCV_1783891 [Trichonephila clavipes]
MPVQLNRGKRNLYSKEKKWRNSGKVNLDDNRNPSSPTQKSSAIERERGNFEENKVIISVKAHTTQAMRRGCSPAQRGKEMKGTSKKGKFNDTNREITHKPGRADTE